MTVEQYYETWKIDTKLLLNISTKHFEIFSILIYKLQNSQRKYQSFPYRRKVNCYGRKMSQQLNAQNNALPLVWGWPLPSVCRCYSACAKRRRAFHSGPSRYGKNMIFEFVVIEVNESGYPLWIVTWNIKSRNSQPPNEIIWATWVFS